MSIFKQVLQYIDKQQWKYRLPEKDKNIALFGIATQNGKFHCIIDVDEVDCKIMFLSIYPVNTPEKNRLQMAELLIRLNYILFFGSFEMDFEDGEIRFKTSLIYEDCPITEKNIQHIMNGNITTMDSHFELLNSFITEKIDISGAIEEINNIHHLTGKK